MNQKCKELRKATKPEQVGTLLLTDSALENNENDDKEYLDCKIQQLKTKLEDEEERADELNDEV